MSTPGTPPPPVCARMHVHMCTQAAWVVHTALHHACCRSESVTVNNFFSSVDGQLELLAQATLDGAVSSAGALHALRPRLSCFHQLLLEPPEVGRVLGGRGGSPGVRAELGQEPNPTLHLQLEPLRTTWGSLAPPLGNTRLHVVKLLASALSANDAALTQELLALDVPNTMLVLGAKGGGAGGGGVGQHWGSPSEPACAFTPRTSSSTTCSTTSCMPKWRCA